MLKIFFRNSVRFHDEIFFSEKPILSSFNWDIVVHIIVNTCQDIE